MESKSWHRVAPALQLCALSAALTGMMLLVGSAPAAAHGENGTEKATAERPEQDDRPGGERTSAPEKLFWAAPPAGR